jgi:hypothetical protein
MAFISDSHPPVNLIHIHPLFVSTVIESLVVKTPNLF